MSERGGGISRRESLRRVGLMAAAGGMPFAFTACAEPGPAAWDLLSLEPVRAPGYGTDPNLIHPAPAPWPKTLSEAELRLVSVLADILIPAEGDWPSATAVGVPEVIDEWVSAPYPLQQSHRPLVLSGLRWCDRECRRRFGRAFVDADETSRLAIVDDIAFPDGPGGAGLDGPRAFFAGFRRLVAGAYYTSPEGARELGYQGNVPIAGDYPGPSEEAMAHLGQVAADLGLEL